MPRLDGITVIAMVLIGSFAVDRVVTGILFLLSFSKWWAARFPDPDLAESAEARASATNRKRLVYFCLAGALAIPLLAGYGQVRILAALGFPTNYLFDTFVTGLILMGGSDRLSEVLKMQSGGGEQKSEPRPITINGKLVLEEGTLKRSAGVAST